MKKLLFLLVAAMSVFFMSCEKKQSTGYVNFTITSDCGTDENVIKIENVIKDSGLPIGQNIPVSADGEDGLEDVKLRVIEILKESQTKAIKDKINALNTGATYVKYQAGFYGSSSLIATSLIEL